VGEWKTQISLRVLQELRRELLRHRLGNAGKDVCYLNKLRRLSSKTPDEGRKLILYMTQKKVQPKARRAASN
jgi:hypothetical protein